MKSFRQFLTTKNLKQDDKEAFSIFKEIYSGTSTASYKLVLSCIEGIDLLSTLRRGWLILDHPLELEELLDSDGIIIANIIKESIEFLKMSVSEKNGFTTNPTFISSIQRKVKAIASFEKCLFLLNKLRDPLYTYSVIEEIYAKIGIPKSSSCGYVDCDYDDESVEYCGLNPDFIITPNGSTSSETSRRHNKFDCKNSNHA